MAEEKIINVGLYGGKGLFGGREQPLEARIIYCDKCDECSFFKNNQCLKIDGFLSPYCKFGRRSIVKGYTSRARKYSDFRSKWKSHEKYGKLSRPPVKLGIIDNVVVFPYNYVSINEYENGSIRVGDPDLTSSIYYIDMEKFTADLIHAICSFRPHAFFGGIIEDYQKKTVPRFLEHLKEVLPDKYQEFVKAYPEYDKAPNYVGRRALLKTINSSPVYYSSGNYPDLNNEWLWDGQYLIYKKGYVSSFNIVDDYKVDTIRLIPGDTAEIVITSNDQVSSETVFVD